VRSCVLSVSLQVQRHADRAPKVSRAAATLLLVLACRAHVPCAPHDALDVLAASQQGVMQHHPAPLVNRLNRARVANPRRLPHVAGRRMDAERGPTRLPSIPPKPPKKLLLSAQPACPLLAVLLGPVSVVGFM
jgi:hypothetical protein